MVVLHVCNAIFYMKRLLPRKDGFKANLFNGADDLMAVTDQEFDYQ